MKDKMVIAVIDDNDNRRESAGMGGKARSTRIRLGHWQLILVVSFGLGPCLFLPIGIAMGQDELTTTTKEPASNPLLDEKERLQLQKEIATLKKEIAEAEKAERAAKLPSTDTTGLQGDVKLNTGAGYFAEVLAYRTLTPTADVIAAKIKKEVKNKTVVVTGDFELSHKAALWEIINSHLTDFEERFTVLMNDAYPLKDGVPDLEQAEGVSLALAALPALLGAAADVAAFFRVDREFTSRAVTLSDRALLAEVGRALLSEAKTVVIPTLGIRSAGVLTEKLTRVQGLRRDSVERRRKFLEAIDPQPNKLTEVGAALDKKKADLAQAEKDKADAAKISAIKGEIEKLEEERFELVRRSDRWSRISGEIDPVLKAFDDLVTALTSPPTDGDKSPLEAVSAVDAVQKYLDGSNNAVVLYAGVVSQGAEIEITKTAWTSGRVSYIGGSSVAYFLVNGDNVLKVSGTETRYLTDSFKGRKGSSALTTSAGTEPSE